ncbi:hypothetical protein QFC19_008271 [Naganishia cerealis]|uniref:Uncharacterized protein n=1 Tax=Naganishia cerealis TaxID=610337 RepID=A0ACC2V343_9TREE|nr:hypothetical protein QFC19_008271 [Naganishia cerealis]
MGIKGIVPYIKRTHPELIKEIPKRWSSPELRGRTVAIDGPLLTSRFFFAAGGQELEEKRMIIGWHALITTMRKAGVTPITVWDVKGERPWKIKEHTRRELQRQLHLSRVLHEDQRQVRLDKGNAENAFRDVSKEIESLIQEVQSSSRPSQRYRGRESAEDAESQAEAETEDSTPIEDRSVETARDPEDGTAIVEDVPAALAAKGGIIADKMVQRTLSESDMDKQQTADTIDLGIINPIENDVQRFGEEDKSLADAQRLGESSSEGVPIETASDMEAGAPVTDDASTFLVTETDIIEDVEIKRALVEPDREYTESPRQMTLTTEEALRLQDIAQAISSGDYEASQIMEFGKDFTDLKERARLVARTYERGHKIPSKWELEECQELMHVMGVPVILAHPPFEAEGLASAMALAGIADFVGTEDTDVLGYEAPLLRNVATNHRPMEIVDGNTLRSAFNLSPQQFIDFLVLMGTDANSRIPGIGPIKAMKMIQQHESIEGILDHNEKLRSLVGPEYLQEVDAARQVFTVLPPLPAIEDLKLPQPDEKVIVDFMRQEHGIDLSSDPGIPNVTEADVELAYEAYQGQSSPEVEETLPS